MTRLALLLLLINSAPALAAVGADSAPSKKEKELAEKSSRPSVRREKAPPVEVAPLVPISIVNVWTREVLPVDPEHRPTDSVVNHFLRCHFTNQFTVMDPRLVDVALRAAARFKSAVIEVVSAYRAPKFNLMLRKKGHAVARDSQHPLGHALDFRLPGLATKTLLKFVRSLGQGGVGYYPHSQFVHADVGPVRFWKGN